MTTKGSTVSVN